MEGVRPANGGWLAHRRLCQHNDLIEQCRGEIAPLIKSARMPANAVEAGTGTGSSNSPRAGPANRRRDRCSKSVDDRAETTRRRVAHDQTVQMIPIERPIRVRR